MSDWTPPHIVGHSTDKEQPDKSQPLFEHLGITQVSAPPPDVWVLQQTHALLELIRPDGVRMSVDFTAGKTRHRTTEAGHGAALLNKALGINTFRKRHGRLPDVIDATGGWGQDGWAMASLGCKVTVFERHPVVFALLGNALARAASNELCHDIAGRISLHHDNAESAMQSVTADVIYLDPMYPSRQRKKADSKKGMQVLHTLLGPADESVSAQLLNAALLHDAMRVAVKRPKGAAPLNVADEWSGQRTTIESPNTRFDVYLT